MRLGVMGGRAVLIAGDRAADIARASDAHLPADPMALLEQWQRLRAWAGDLPADAYDIPVDHAALGAPVPRPRQVFAVAYLSADDELVTRIAGIGEIRQRFTRPTDPPSGW